VDIIDVIETYTSGTCEAKDLERCTEASTTTRTSLKLDRQAKIDIIYLSVKGHFPVGLSAR
jgi:hypothetical protein